jgi:hypothetical protein
MQTLKQAIKRAFPGWVYGHKKSTAAKASVLDWVKRFKNKPVSGLSDASYDVFTFHGEDGIILYLLDHMKDVPPFFVDIGAGDCIRSNCSTLAVHFGWQGLFIDQDAGQLAVGKSFYKHMVAKGVKLKMIQQQITAGNINELLKNESLPHDTGLLSIDIDGNDYWVWKAIDVIRPRIVIIEAKVEFGPRNIIVPDGDHNHHSVDKMYNGASVEALRILGKEKGYKLVGANKYGYNLFFVKENEPFPAVSTADILDQPGTKESFYPESFFTTHTFAHT